MVLTMQFTTLFFVAFVGRCYALTIIKGRLGSVPAVGLGGDALGVNLADKETEREFEGRIVQAIETIEKSEENLDAPSHTLFCMRQATTFVELAGVIYEAVFSIGERQCPDTKTQPFLYTKRTTETLACKKADTRCQPCYIKPNGQFAVCYMRLFKESWRKDLPEKILSQKCIGVSKEEAAKSFEQNDS